ncbi:hypothetical protein [Bradyrhizobium sp. 162]|uniref:hypothetical protein n=1 Tax=Bradyrhizobium sp. 162 TaxID=2782635 RepID=UPI001FF7C18D|nr:hypothetical protein [Bradyrhizobium sp. 162]MCK1629662.1 hypothetical protein [Bradyrhizobium sp. 162]
MERSAWVFARAPARGRLGCYGAVSQRIALLGNLATVEDQVKAKSLELDAAYIQNGVGVGKMRDAVLSAVRAQAEMSRVQEQAAIGVFSFRDASKAASDQLQSWVSRGLLDPKNLEQFGAAANYSTKQLEELSDQAKVAAAALPQFQQAMNDATNARKQLDGLATEAMSVNRGFFTTFGQQIRQGANAWDAFKSSGLDALGKIADKLSSMAADKLFASAFGGSSSGGGLLGSLFGLGSGSTPVMSSGLGAGTGGLSFPMFADGGMLSGGWGVVGERGPELINVHKGGVTVIPNHVSKPFLPGFADGGSMDSAGNVRRMPFGQGGGVTIHAGDTHISIDGNADEKTVALMRAELARDRASRYSDTVKIVQNAKKRRDL